MQATPVSSAAIGAADSTETSSASIALTEAAATRARINSAWVWRCLLLVAFLASLSSPLSAAEPAPPPPPAPDLIALDTMARHHEGTKTMARATEAQAPNKKLRAFAARFARDADSAHTRLQAWRDRWYPRAVRAIDADAPGMAELQRELTLLAEVPPDRLEAEFLEKMQRHLDNGVQLARRMQGRAQRAELKAFARDMATQAQRQQTRVKQRRQALEARAAASAKPSAKTDARTGSAPAPPVTNAPPVINTPPATDRPPATDTPAAPAAR